MARFEESVSLLRKHLLKYNQLGEEDILDIVKGRLTNKRREGVLVYGMSGRPIKPRSANQQELIDAYGLATCVFARRRTGGTGKTYLSIALAVKALKEKTAKKIILSRPAVEARRKQNSARRHEGQDRPLPPAALRRPGGHAPQARWEGHDGQAPDTDCAPGLHARSYLATRSSTRHRTPPSADPHVPRPYGMEHR